MYLDFDIKYISFTCTLMVYVHYYLEIIFGTTFTPYKLLLGMQGALAMKYLPQCCFYLYHSEETRI